MKMFPQFDNSVGFWHIWFSGKLRNQRRGVHVDVTLMNVLTVLRSRPRSSCAQRDPRLHDRRRPHQHCTIMDSQHCTIVDSVRSDTGAPHLAPVSEPAGGSWVDPCSDEEQHRAVAILFSLLLSFAFSTSTPKSAQAVLTVPQKSKRGGVYSPPSFANRRIPVLVCFCCRWNEHGGAALSHGH